MESSISPDAIRTREDLGRALTDLRVRAGLSVREVTDHAGALQGTVAGWFAGQHAPTRASREMFENVLIACGVDDPGNRQQWWSAVERTTRRGGRRRTRPEPPYRGFAPFDAADSALFFGRDDLTQRLVELIASRRGDELPIVMVVGASGVGKSSLVRAGVLAQTTGDGHLAGWHRTVLVPGRDPVGSLEDAVAAVPAPADDVPDSPTLLIVDQLEELWTQNDRDARVAFRDRLLRMISERDVVMVGVIRADFYGDVASVNWLAPALQQAQIVVSAMSVEQMREVIVGPARVAGVKVDDSLVQMLIDDLAPGHAASDRGVPAGALPLLSHALRATWDISDGQSLTVGDYLATGRIGGAVEQTAEQVYGGLTPDEQSAARRLLLSMVNVDDDTVTRRTITLEPDARNPLLERFASARLVTVWETGALIAHEALLSAWPRLTGWIDEDRERLRLQRRLRSSREIWETNGRPDDLLPGQMRLAMFTQLVDDSADLDRADHEFLAAAQAKHAVTQQQREHQQRRLRRFALVATVFGIVAVLAAITAIVAGVNARNERRDAEVARDEAMSRELAVQSSQLRERDSVLSTQLAMLAYRESPTIQARSALIESVARGVPAQFVGDGSPALAARAGSRLATLSAQGRMRIFDISDDGITGLAGEFQAGGDGARFAGIGLSTDMRTAYVGGQGTLTMWDVSDPARAVRGAALPGVRGDVNAIAIGPGDRWVVASEPGVGVQAWLSEGQGRWRLIPLPDKVSGSSGAVAFSPDGTLLATSSANQRIDLWRVGADTLDPVAEIRLDGHDNQLAQGLSFTPDGRSLLAALRSRVIATYDVTEPAAPRPGPQYGGFTSYVTAVTTDADGSHIVGAGADNSVRVFQRDDPSSTPRVLTSAANISSVIVAGSHLIGTGDDGRLLDWPADEHHVVVGSGSVYQIPADTAASRLIAADTTVDGRLSQWTVRDGTIGRAGPDLLPAAGTVFSGAVVQSASGHLAVSGSDDGTVYFADYSDPTQPRVVGRVAAQTTLNETVDYSDHTHLAVTGATDSTVLTTIDAADPSAPKVAGRIDVGSGICWAALSPDGRLAAVATTNGAVRLVDVSTPSTPTIRADVHKFPSTALAVRFSPDGRRLVSTSDAKTVAVNDISDPSRPREISTMSGPAGQLYSAAFSPDGSRIVAGGGNSEVWIWDVDGDSVRPTAVLRTFPGRVYDVRFAGDRVLAAGEHGTIASWQIDPEAILDAQCRRPGDQITREEWRNYVPSLPYAPPCR